MMMNIHEDSENCKFGSNCARSLCMYKHEESVDKEWDDNEDSSEDDDVDDMLTNDGINFEDIKPAWKNLNKLLRILRSC